MSKLTKYFVQNYNNCLLKLLGEVDNVVIFIDEFIIICITRLLCYIIMCLPM